MASTRWFNLFFPAKHPPERHRFDNPPAAASLPPELLLEIFYHTARSTRAPDRDTVVYPTLDELERSSRHPLVGALLTCSRWTGPATVALYEQIGTFRFFLHIPLQSFLISLVRPVFSSSCRTLPFNHHSKPVQGPPQKHRQGIKTSYSSKCTSAMSERNLPAIRRHYSLLSQLA